MASGTVQIWPGTPVAEALIEGERVCGVRLRDQGVDRDGNPEAGFMPGMDVRAALTVVGDGPVGAVGRQLDEQFGLPRGPSPARVGRGHEDGGGSARRSPTSSPARSSTPSAIPSRRSSASSTCIRTAWPPWASSCPPGSAAPCAPPTATCSTSCCIPTCGAICRAASCARGAPSRLQESGRRGEPFLAGDGYARIGEGSGSTNVLTGSGVDEAWTTGIAARRGRPRTAAAQASRSPRRTWSRPTWRAAAQAGWSRKAASPRRPATASTAA